MLIITTNSNILRSFYSCHMFYVNFTIYKPETEILYGSSLLINSLLLQILQILYPFYTHHIHIILNGYIIFITHCRFFFKILQLTPLLHQSALASRNPFPPPFFFHSSPDFHKLWHSVMCVCLFTEVKRQWATLVLGRVTTSVHYCSL